jgi:cytoskeletal protein CcmA (bactofilin family)
MADQACIIGSQITIRGNITGSEDLYVEGRVEGSIQLGNHLTVESTGTVEADIEVEDLTVNGTVQGDIVATRSITINPDAKVIGTLRAPRIIIADGARFKGKVEMDVALPADLTR